MRHMLTFLQRVWTYAITTKSDLAREYADVLAEAASRGFITTEVVHARAFHGRLWKITVSGLQYLFLHSDVIADDEVANYVESYCG